MASSCRICQGSVKLQDFGLCSAGVKNVYEILQRLLRKPKDSQMKSCQPYKAKFFKAYVHFSFGFELQYVRLGHFFFIFDKGLLNMLNVDKIQSMIDAC